MDSEMADERLDLSRSAGGQHAACTDVTFDAFPEFLVSVEIISGSPFNTVNL
jgi:hypothetical protein